MTAISTVDGDTSHYLRHFLSRDQYSQLQATKLQCVEKRCMPLMNTVPSTLSSDTKRLTSELKRLVQRFQLEPAPDPVTLQEFRHVVDNVRLAAWNVSELIYARQGEKASDTMVGFLAGERLRRFDQLAKNIASKSIKHRARRQSKDQAYLSRLISVISVHPW
jgi:hypothetical protein